MNTEQFNGHSPGPWDVIRDCRNDVVISHGGEETVCRLPHYPLFNNAQFKNAHLIAAAPELLAAYKQKAQLADALWDFIEYYCPHLLHEATDCWNNNSGEYRLKEDEEE